MNSGSSIPPGLGASGQQLLFGNNNSLFFNPSLETLGGVAASTRDAIASLARAGSMNPSATSPAVQKVYKTIESALQGQRDTVKTILDSRWQTQGLFKNIAEQSRELYRDLYNA